MKVIIECANDKKRYTLYNATSFSQRLDLCENYDVFNFRVDREKVVYNDIRFRNIESVQCIPVNNMFHYWESYKEESSDMFNRNYPRKLTGIYEIREFYIKFNDVKDFQNIPVSDGYLCYV